MKIFGVYNIEEKEQCTRVRNSNRDSKIFRDNSKEI